MISLKNILLVSEVVLFFSMIITLILFFIKFFNAKKKGDLLKIEKIEKAPIVETKWYNKLFAIIIILMLGSRKFTNYEDILALLLIIFFSYLAISAIINLIKVK